MGALVSALSEGIKPVNFGINTPVQNQAQMATLAGLQQENALKAQQTQQANLQNQLIQRTLNDQDIMRQVYRDLPDNANVNDLLTATMKADVSPEMKMNMQKHAIDVNQALSVLDKTQREVAQQHFDDLIGAANGAANTDDPVAAQKYWDQVNQVANKMPGGAAALGITQGFPGKDAASLLVKSHQPYSQQLKDLDAASKRALEAQQTEEARQKALGEATTNKIDQFKLNLLQNVQTDPSSGADALDSIIPPDKYPQLNNAFKREYSTAGANMDDLNEISKERQRVIARAVDQMREIDPVLLQSKVDQKVKEETALGPVRTAQKVAEVKATLPLEVSKAVQTEIQKAALSPDSFASVFDPAARARAQSDYQKINEELSNKLSDAAKFDNFLTAAESGNKNAPGLLGVAELRSLVNRVNRQELQAVSEKAGNAYDRVQGFISGWTEGQPIPKAILSDMHAVNAITEQAAKGAYNAKRISNNATYGAKAPDISDQLSAAVKGQAPAGGSPTPARQNPNPNAYIPGHVYDGKTYLGGDPNNRASWKF